jgi:hypothetical protein
MITVIKLLRRCALEKDIVSYNDVTGHWSHKSHSWKQRQLWGLLLRSSEGLDIPIPQTEHRRKLIITRVVSGRMKKMEPANFPSGMKPVEDALVDLKWLIDDAPKYVETELKQIEVAEAEDWLKKLVETRRAKTAVEIYDLDSPICNRSGN